MSLIPISRLFYVNLSQHCCHLNEQQFGGHHFSFCGVCAHTSHHRLCAVACVYSIFINSYFYSKPCWFQSLLSKPWLQPKYQWEEQWENWQLWKGRTFLPDVLSIKMSQKSPALTQPSLVLWFLDPKTLVFDRLNSSIWQVRSSGNQEPSYVLSSYYEDNFRR